MNLISRSKKSRPSVGLKVVIFIFLVFGLVMLSSAGIVEGERVHNSKYFFVTHQLLYGALPGLIAFLILSKVSFKVWKRLSSIILLAGIILTVLVFVPGFESPLRGAHRWIGFGGMQFQPAELLKLTLIIYLAAWFGKREKRVTLGKSLTEFIPVFVVMATIAFLLIKQPDMGTLGILIIIASSLYFLAGTPMKSVVIMGVAVLAMLITFAVVEPYRFERIKTYLNPQSDVQGSAYHINQALISIGSGGLFGLGYGQSRQKFSSLPEPVGDSIFAIIVEELGFVGGAFVLALYLAMFWVLLRIAMRAEDGFARLYALGMGVWITSQAFINIAAISGIIPLTGVPLPFISYGSSSMLALLTGLGIAENISKKYN